jgi:hypothetical protein
LCLVSEKRAVLYVTDKIKNENYYVRVDKTGQKRIKKKIPKHFFRTSPVTTVLGDVKNFFTRRTADKVAHFADKI